MRIALFSDIHANLPALETCLARIDALAPDQIYCLGDLVGYNIWPNEVIDLIRSRDITTIPGNYDKGIGLHSDDCGCAYKTDEEKAMGKISIGYTNRIIGNDQRAFLRGMLDSKIASGINMSYGFSDHSTDLVKKINLVLVHGSPRRINEYLFEDRPEDSMLRIMRDASADILCFGHTHKPYHRIIHDPETNRSLQAINIGSVGKPKDGDPRGCFVMLDIDQEKIFNQPLSLKAEFIRFEYDVEKAARAVEDSPLPNEYADMLRRGV